MSLQPGQSLLHYRIVDKIGEGGMGAVWRADDTTLDRQVAIKVLPQQFAADPERLARFEREAKVLASLNHPNIASIYGLHQDGDVRFLAMELVDGEDLARRLDRGPLPVDEALNVAAQVCDAVASAHEQGVVHRDLKPANIQLTAAGKIKVLDFGLAKALAPDPGSGSGSVSMSPTVTSAGSVAGVILGTAAYMSPEQARGHPVDRRADIWAFGCVLFELLTGAKAFGGQTISDALASVLKTEPDWTSLPGETPGAIRRLLRRSLVKDPDRRLRDIADALLEIEDARHEPTEAHAPARPPRGALGRAIPWAVAGAAILLAGWFGFVAQQGGPAALENKIVSSILPPPEMGFDLDRGLALSPDGTRLAFSARDENGLGKLWIRTLDRANSRPLAGTDHGVSPFWSPDGRHLGFFARGFLKKIDLETDVVETLADADWNVGGTWNAQGDIVFAGRRGGLQRVAASGGEVEQVTTVTRAGTDDHMWPSFLPDGRHFLYQQRSYAADGEVGQLWLGSLDGSVSEVLFEANSGARYAPPGYLVWWQQGNLRAQRFDAASRALEGEPIALIADVRFDPRIASAAFSVSDTGVLVYQRGGTLSGDHLVWIDREGKVLGTVGPAGSLYDPVLSPDGSRIAVDISDETNQGDIWVIDVRRDQSTRLTSGTQDESCPVWSPDGGTLAYCSVSADERFAVFERSSRGGGEARIVYEDSDGDLNPVDWRGDSVLLTREERGTDLPEDILVASTKDGTIRPYLTTRFEEDGATFSPDGRYVVYSSDETGRIEVYVQSFPEPGQAWRISVDGGGMPRFHPDGSELFFVSPRKEFMSVAVSRAGDGLEFGVPRALFRVDVKVDDTPQWDTADGERFLFNVAVRAGAGDPLTLVQGWTAGLQD